MNPKAFGASFLYWVDFIISLQFYFFFLFVFNSYAVILFFASVFLGIHFFSFNSILSISGHFHPCFYATYFEFSKTKLVSCYDLTIFQLFTFVICFLPFFTQFNASRGDFFFLTGFTKYNLSHITNLSSGKKWKVCNPPFTILLTIVNWAPTQWVETWNILWRFS